MVKSMGSLVPFINNKDSLASLTNEEQEKLFKVLISCFRLPTPEYTIMGLKNLLEINRHLIQEAFAEVDDPEVTKFIFNNKNVLGL